MKLIEDLCADESVDTLDWRRRLSRESAEREVPA
jgi:hypothetical protein